MKSVPGKIILFGEHAVVYGQPAIAVPLQAVQASAAAEVAPSGTGLIVHAPDLGQTLCYDDCTDTDPLYSALLYPLCVTLRRLNQPVPDLTLTVHSTIPIASGLGSGAAVAAALIRELVSALGANLDDTAINELVYEVEKRHHGTPSGIDNTVIVFNRPVYFVRGQPIATFQIAQPFTLLVGDTGQGSPTKLAVGDVRQLYDADPDRLTPLFSRIGDIARAARAAIESGAVDSLGPLMDENHALLRDMTVSSDDLDRLCAAARQAGALGAKLSGGGRGGNMIALVTPDTADRVRAALHHVGAVRVLETVVTC